jgi:hypothetical protein
VELSKKITALEFDENSTRIYLELDLADPGTLIHRELNHRDVRQEKIV